MIDILIQGKKIGVVSLDGGNFRFYGKKRSSQRANRRRQTTTAYGPKLLNYFKLIWILSSHFTKIENRNFIQEINISQV